MYPAQTFFSPLVGQGKKEVSFKVRTPGGGSTTSRGGLTLMGWRRARASTHGQLLAISCPKCKSKLLLTPRLSCHHRHLKLTLGSALESRGRRWLCSAVQPNLSPQPAQPSTLPPAPAPVWGSNPKPKPGRKHRVRISTSWGSCWVPPGTDLPDWGWKQWQQGRCTVMVVGRDHREETLALQVCKGCCVLT